MPFVKADALQMLEDEYGWKPYPQKHFESRFTKFYEGYWLYERFGYDTRRVQLSSLILTGQMNRDEAMEILKKPPYNPQTIHPHLSINCAQKKLMFLYDRFPTVCFGLLLAV